MRDYSGTNRVLSHACSVLSIGIQLMPPYFLDRFRRPINTFRTLSGDFPRLSTFLRPISNNLQDSLNHLRAVLQICHKLRKALRAFHLNLLRNIRYLHKKKFFEIHL